MNNRDQNSSEDGINGIRSERMSNEIWAKWLIDKKPLLQIADEMNLSIAEVQQVLTRREKPLIQSLIKKGSLKR